MDLVVFIPFNRLTKSNPDLSRMMTMTINTAKIENILQNFVTGTSEVQGAALVSPDGLPLASSLPNEMDEERVSAMSAAMLSLGERIGSELSRGFLDRIYVEGDRGYGILTNCGEYAVLLVLASKAAKQGVLLLEIKRVIPELKAALDPIRKISGAYDTQSQIAE
jgi:predicted regulator of Ras-like GTPase activity (Roadblock/LC7/MglB family)